MKKRLSLVMSMSALLSVNAILPIVALDVPYVHAQEQLSNNKVSLGASLDAAKIEKTLELLQVEPSAATDQIKIDGPKVNDYIKDGSTAETKVYSSAVIEPRQPGYGVQVEIVTPQTIQNVSAQTYQNAAITSGAKDVLIKIASVEPVTGEGALAGVYAIFEANGYKLNAENIQTAQDEISLPEKLKLGSKLTDKQINELTRAIKLAISTELDQTGEMTEARIQEIIDEQVKALAQKYNVTLKSNINEILFQVMKKYAQLKVDTGTITDSNQEAWTAEQAIDLYESAMTLKSGSAPRALPKDYDRTLWRELKKEGSNLILQNGLKFYLFEKGPDTTNIYCSSDMDNIMENYDFKILVDHSSRLVYQGYYPMNMVKNEEGNYEITNKDLAKDYLVKALFSSISEDNLQIAYLQSSFDPQVNDQDGSYNFVVQDQDGTSYGAYKVDPDGLIKDLVNMKLSGYDVYVPAFPQPSEQTPSFDRNKAQALEDFMAVWGEGMNQIYRSYTPELVTSMYGLNFPSRAIELLSVNDQEVNAYWSMDGISKQAGDYAIVAAYSDRDDFSEKNPTAPYGANFYLFAIKDGKPIVLNSQQNQGQPDGLVHFYPTQNAELQTGFEEIVMSGQADLTQVTTIESTTTTVENPNLTSSQNAVADAFSVEQALAYLEAKVEDMSIIRTDLVEYSESMGIYIFPVRSGGEYRVFPDGRVIDPNGLAL